MLWKALHFHWANVILAACIFVSHWEVMAHISIYWGFCFWSAWFALWCKSIFFDLFWRVKLFIAANKGLPFLQSAFWIWITKRFWVMPCCIFSTTFSYCFPSFFPSRPEGTPTAPENLLVSVGELNHRWPKLAVRLKCPPSPVKNKWNSPG